MINLNECTPNNIALKYMTQKWIRTERRNRQIFKQNRRLQKKRHPSLLATTKSEWPQQNTEEHIPRGVYCPPLWWVRLCRSGSIWGKTSLVSLGVFGDLLLWWIKMRTLWLFVFIIKVYPIDLLYCINFLFFLWQITINGGGSNTTSFLSHSSVGVMPVSLD